MSVEMTKRTPKKKWLIPPPIRHSPPARESLIDCREDDAEGGLCGIQSEERGFAGSDDIVQWLAVLTNEKNFSYGRIAKASSVPCRTVKKWFDVNEKTRASPSLKNTQACLEALGQSRIAVRPSVTLGEREYDYPIYRVRRELLEKRIEQSAKLQSMSPDALIEKSNSEYKMIARLGSDWPGPTGGGARWHA
jgi:hypothetical protein